jgi:hypothetical protein
MRIGYLQWTILPLAMAACGTAPHVASAQPAPAAGTVEAWLTTSLTDLGNRCFPGSDGRRFREATTPRSLVADPSELSLRAEELRDQAALPALFRFVFFKKDFSDWRANKHIGSRLFDSDPNLFGRFQPDVDFNNLHYRSSCMSMLRAALDANAGNVPLSPIRAAVSTEFSAQNRQDLSIMRGRFLSPLGMALRTSGPERVAANMRVWRHYVARGYPDSAFYLDNVTGWLTITVKDIQRKTSGRLEASGGANWMVASINASLQVGAQTDDQLMASGFRVLVLVDSPSVTQASWERLPTDSAIGAVLEEFTTPAQGTDLQLRYASPGASQVHRQIMDGLPANLCVPNAWNPQVTPASGNSAWGSLSLDNVAPVSATDARCAFVVRYIPSFSAIPTTELADGDIDLTYSIRFRQAAGPRSLSFGAGAAIPISNRPTVVPPSVAVEASVDTTGRASFRVPFSINDEGVPIDRDNFANPRLSLTDAKLACGGWERILPNVSIEREGVIYYLQGAHVFGNRSADRPSTGACNVTVALPLPRPGGATLQRTLEAPVAIDLMRLNPVEDPAEQRAPQTAREP